MSARRLVLIHWKQEEAERRASQLRTAGFEVEILIPQGAQSLGRIKANLPDAIAIDLDRLPMQGRDVAVILRRAKATRHLPLIFLGGEPEKISRVKQVLPDAIFPETRKLGEAIERAIAQAPVQPSVPTSGMAGYAGTPLLKKLRISENTRVSLVNAPPGLLGDIAEVPLEPGCDLVLWFVRSREELEAQVDGMAAALRQGSIWIIWPKKKPRRPSALSQVVVRKAAQSAGLVDYKICSIDSTWSGLLFAKKTLRR